MEESWDENGVHTQAKILAFDQVCEYDESQTAGMNLFPGKKRR